MPIVNDLNTFGERADDTALAAAGLAQTGEFVKGMRSGGNAAMGSLNNLAGAVGQKLGAEEFATGRFNAADQYNADAAATAPRVASMRDINGIGDFVDWGKGLAGGVVPVGAAALGATLLTGGGAIPAIAAGTAATAPFEVGDVVGRMRERGQPIDLTRAAVGGVGSAALQNVLPGVARARLGGTAGRLPGGALASIPEQAALAAGSEAGKQVVANPSAPLEMGQIGDAAAGGAVMGVPIAGMSALGGARGQIGAAADAVGGKVKDAAQFVGDKAKGVTKATTEAADAGTKRVEGMEIPDALAGIFDSGKAKARDMLDKIAASEDVVGDISKFAGLQGEKLKQALAGDDGERLQAVKDYAKKLGDQHPAVRDWMQDMGNHAKQAAVATAKMAKDTKDTAMDHLTRFADSVDEWSNARKFKRTDGNKYAGGETVDAETRRVDPSPDGVVDAEVRDVTIRRLLKSEDDSGIRQALAEKLIPELLKARPELADMAGDPEVATQLHRAFAPLIEDLASGKRPSRDVVARLVDLAGPAADRLIEVAHSVVGDSTDPAKTRAFFKGLNEFTQVRDSADMLAQAQHKLLRPELQRSTSNHDLREEARLLMKWLDDKRPTEGPKADPEAQRLKYRMEKYLEIRYGENSKKLLVALEKARPKEENQIERARVKYDEDGQPIDDGVESEFSESGSPNGQMRYFGGGRKGTDLFVHPEDDPGKKGYPGAAMQRLAKVQAMYPESTARFITASEMGLDHPWVEGRYEQLVKIGNEAGVDGDRYAMKQLDRFGVIATERATHGTDLTFDELDAMKFDRHKYDAENSPAALFTGHFIEKRGKDGEVEKIETVLDAVKITKSMMKRFKGEYAPGDDIGEQARTARVGRMFIEGVAAAQTYLGKSFDIPDNTLLGRFDNRDVTWADVKKLDRRSAADRKNDDTTKYLEGLRKAIMATEDKELRKALIREGFEADAERQLAKNVDLTREDSRKVDDEPGTGYTSDVGIPISRVPPNPDERSNPAISRRSYSRKTKDDFKTGEIGEGIPGDMGLPNLTARMKRIGEVNGELGPIFERMEDGTATAADRVKATALRKELDVLSKVREAESTGRTEIDPFGPTHDALRGEGKLGIMKGTGKGMNTRTYDIGRAPESIHTDSGEARDDFLPQRINKPGTALPENAPGAARPKAEPTPDATIGTDREYGNKSWPALRKAAAEAAKKFSDPAWDSDHAGFMLDGKRYSVQQERPGQWYVKNDEGDIIHSVGKAVKKPAGAPPLDRRVADRVDALTASEDYSSLNTRPKVDAFLDAARKRFDELRSIDGDLTEQQSKALGTLYGLFGKGSTADLASFYDGVEGGPPNPKAVAAKKAALLERARSGDESLIGEIQQHTDAVGLQNAVLHLARKGDVMEANTARAISALNERIGELVREQPQQAYDMLKTDRSGGKKYSMDQSGDVLHHGTRAPLEKLIDADGNLVLKPSKNFGGKTFGVSFTDDAASAKDYAIRVKGGGPAGFSYEGAKVLKIQRGALKNVEQELMREWADYSGKDVIVPKGQYEIEHVKRERAFMRDSHLKSAFNEWVKDNYRGLEREEIAANPRDAVENFLGEVTDPASEYTPADVAEAAAILRDEYGYKKFNKSMEGVSPGRQGKKYSLESTRIHEELERPGFAATHDSPIRHEGKFDWRAHSGKGEGNASFGAGTYLSTADGVHRNYKNQFTAKVSESPDITSFPFLKQLSGISRKQALDAANAMVPMFATSARELREAFAGMADALDGVSADALKELGYTPESAEDTKRIARLAASAADADFEFELGDTKSPTYHVSVDIPPERLLDWDAPLSEQSEFVRTQAQQIINDNKLKFYNPGTGKSSPMTLDKVGRAFYMELTEKFGSQREVSEYLERMGVLGHKYAASGGKNDAHPNYVIYDDSKISTNYVHFDKSGVDPNRQGPINRKEVYEYINRTLGNSVLLAWERLGHAGEFERVQGKGNAPTEDVIRLSVHAMNPLSTAFHESMHAFIQKLNDQKHGKIVDVLFKAGESAPVMNQLRKWMAERGMGDKALAQLKDPEERAAYMYQAWADGKLNVGDQTKTVLGKIADFIRSVLGIWSNDARALHIMEYFHSGDFAKNMANRDQVYKDLMVPGRNKAIETARKMTQPILELGENLGVAGAQRLRDTGIPALRELADQMKLHTVAEGDDPGFVPAARAERTRVMNRLAADLKDFSAESVQAALESLQQKSNDPIKAMADQKARGDAFTAKVVVRKLLDDMYGYMTGAGVKVADLGVGKDYFPRQYDVSYISSHQQEFKNVLDRHGVKNADKVLSKIMVSEGAEFTTVVTDKPGMQHLKPRDLAFIPEAELAPFMRKNLTEILNGYVTQATRRAEWAKRFGDDGKGVNKLIAEAQRQGATPDDVDSAWKFVRAVNGTLGDTINPEARRLFGNMIVYQNVRLLPLMIFSSVVDPMGIMVRGGTMADSFAAFKRGVSEIPKNFKKNPQDDAATKFAASIGVIDDTTLVHTLGALYSQGMVGDTGRKINDTLFRYNLAEQFNTSMRVSATEAAMGFLARHADGTASPHSRRWLSELGLEPNELTFDANGRVKVTEADGLTPEQSVKVKAAINRWVDGAVLRPDAADKPIWMSDPHWSLISHLKQFTYSFHETILKRVAHEYQNGNYTPAMALMSYVPMMIAADMAKGLIQGGGEEPEWKQNWGVGDYVAAGVERAGLLGVGQFGVDMLRDAVRGGTGVGALAGPTVEQFAEAARMLGGRESFGQFVLKSMPANALYAGAVDVEPADPKFVD